jgi:hypothetical protein
MFTTGSKILIGGSVLATVAAIVYGGAQNEALGTVGLISAAIALALLAGFNVWAGDSNLSATDATAIATSDAATEPPGASIWPMVFAVGAATVLVGLVTQQSIFTIGVIALLAAGAQWMVQAWAESASADSAVNADVRNRVANPLEYPLLGAVAVGVIAFAFSRVMLWLSKTNTVFAFVILATVIALIAFFFAFRPSVKRGAISAALGLGAVAIVASGVAAGVDGERDIHEHETTSTAAAEGLCASPEEGEYDENASQTISMKSSTYTITLTESDELEFDVPGPVEAGAEAMTLPRSNPNNIVFRNDSDEERRLTYDFRALTEDEIAEVEAAKEEESHGGEAESDEAHSNVERLQQCTTLLEPGGAQLMTLLIAEPSFAPSNDDEAFRFFVPGTDAELEVMVP